MLDQERSLSALIQDQSGASFVMASRLLEVVDSEAQFIANASKVAPLMSSIPEAERELFTAFDQAFAHLKQLYEQESLKEDSFFNREYLLNLTIPEALLAMNAFFSEDNFFNTQYFPALLEARKYYDFILLVSEEYASQAFNFRSFLDIAITVVQRFPRYGLFFNDFVKQISKEEGLQNLLSAGQEAIQEKSQKVNHSLNLAEYIHLLFRRIASISSGKISIQGELSPLNHKREFAKDALEAIQKNADVSMLRCDEAKQIVEDLLSINTHIESSLATRTAKRLTGPAVGLTIQRRYRMFLGKDKDMRSEERLNPSEVILFCAKVIQTSRDSISEKRIFLRWIETQIENHRLNAQKSLLESEPDYEVLVAAYCEAYLAHETIAELFFKSIALLKEIHDGQLLTGQFSVALKQNTSLIEHRLKPAFTEYLKEISDLDSFLIAVKEFNQLKEIIPFSAEDAIFFGWKTIYAANRLLSEVLPKAENQVLLMKLFQLIDTSDLYGAVEDESRLLMLKSLTTAEIQVIKADTQVSLLKNLQDLHALYRQCQSVQTLNTSSLCQDIIHETQTLITQTMKLHSDKPWLKIISSSTQPAEQLEDWSKMTAILLEFKTLATSRKPSFSIFSMFKKKAENTDENAEFFNEILNALKNPMTFPDSRVFSHSKHSTP